MRLLVPAMNMRRRSLTGGVIWLALAALAGVQLIGPAGISIPAGPYALLIGGSTVAGLLCALYGNRVSERLFEKAEQVLLALVWPSIAVLVALTDGAVSANIALFACGFCYAAYFLSVRTASVQIALGTIALWVPLAYDQPAAANSGFVVRAAAMTLVLWAMAVVISRNAAALCGAELAARRLALTDPLAGVANMRTFDAAFAEELACAYDSEGSFGVAFVDVNGLKAANTVFGHAGGDRLIQDTARVLLASSGPQDQVARLGGDEFAVLLAEADAERVAGFQECFAINLAEVNGSAAARGPRLSASIGVAAFPDDDSLDELMQIADARMYNSRAALPRSLPTPETSGGRRLSPNDATSGHHHLSIGDIPGTAPALEGAIPSADRVCRIGGDEFAIVVSNGSEHAVARIAALSRAAVHEVDWSGFIPAGLTVSVGYSTWSAVDEWQDLVVAADLALRISKDTGKDAITSAPAGPGTLGPSVSLGAAAPFRASAVA